MFINNDIFWTFDFDNTNSLSLLSSLVVQVKQPVGYLCFHY